MPDIVLPQLRYGGGTTAGKFQILFLDMINKIGCKLYDALN